MTANDEPANSEHGPDNTRLVALSDGVFAIAITLLVINIEVPDSSDRLRQDVLDQWPKILAYITTFLLIGVYWSVHHRLFNYLKSHDTTLIWLNMLLLMSVSFLPFPSGILGRHGEQQFAIIFYALSMTVASLLSSLMWWYSLSRPRLLRRPVGAAERRAILVRGFSTPAVFLLSIPISFVSVGAAELWWVVIFIIRRALAGRNGA